MRGGETKSGKRGAEEESAFSSFGGVDHLAGKLPVPFSVGLLLGVFGANGEDKYLQLARLPFWAFGFVLPQ